MTDDDIHSIVDYVKNKFYYIHLYVKDLDQMEELVRRIQTLYPGETNYKEKRFKIYWDNGRVEPGAIQFYVLSEFEAMAGHPILVCNKLVGDPLNGYSDTST